MHNGSHMDANRIYDLTVVHVIKCNSILGPALFICCRSRNSLVQHWLNFVVLVN